MGRLEHVYRAGNWLGEITYDPGEYRLCGVSPGYARFPREHNLVIEGARPAANPGSDLYAEMIFPYPDDIRSIQSLGIDPSTLFEGASLPMVQSSRKISTLEVLTYRFTNHLKLRLDGHPWSAIGTMVGGFCTLHVIAEPDRPMQEDMGQQHVKNAFSVAMKMYDQVNLQMAKASDPVPHVTMDQIPFGARIEEMQDLCLRLNSTMTKLGCMKKRGDNLNTLWDEYAQGGGQPEGSDILRCSQSIGTGSPK
jgi:hypothetical protein